MFGEIQVTDDGNPTQALVALSVIRNEDNLDRWMQSTTSMRFDERIAKAHQDAARLRSAITTSVHEFIAVVNSEFSHYGFGTPIDAE